VLKYLATGGKLKGSIKTWSLTFGVMFLGQFRDPPDCTLTKACRGDGVGCADDSRVPLAGFTSNRMGNSTQGSLWKFSGGLPREDEESGGSATRIQWLHPAVQVFWFLPVGGPRGE
jgi:hypothetical protein